jgi:hypothetical protein
MRHVIKNITLLIIIAILISGTATVYAIHKLLPAETMVPLPGPDSRAVYEYIKGEDPYKKWFLWPGKDRLYKGKHPHGAYLTTYVNDNAKFSIRAGEPMANGSIVVKENYTEEKKLDNIAVMYKIKSYNPSAGDWFWVKYANDGKVIASGKVKTCIECHSTKKKNDYLFTTDFVK